MVLRNVPNVSDMAERSWSCRTYKTFQNFKIGHIKIFQIEKMIGLYLFVLYEEKIRNSFFVY